MNNTIKFLMVGAIVLAFSGVAFEFTRRLSDEAIMTIVGVSCGIAASLPVSIGILIALTRERTSYSTEYDVDDDPEPSPYIVHSPRMPQKPQQPQLPKPPEIIVIAPPNSRHKQKLLEPGDKRQLD